MGNVHGANALATEPVCGSARIELTKGLTTLVDAADFEWLSKWRWYAQRGPRSGFYVVRTDYTRGHGGGRQQQILLHRVLVGATKGQFVDHRNGDTLDNRRSNLRICTAAQNSRNMTSSKLQKLGRFKGVAWDPRRKKWRAVITVPGPDGGRGKQRCIGRFATAELAARAYDAAARAMFGEFAAPNFRE